MKSGKRREDFYKMFNIIYIKKKCAKKLPKSSNIMFFIIITHLFITVVKTLVCLS